jgi:hypothetical protein
MFFCVTGGPCTGKNAVAETMIDVYKFKFVHLDPASPNFFLDPENYSRHRGVLFITPDNDHLNSFIKSKFHAVIIRVGATFAVTASRSLSLLYSVSFPFLFLVQ